MVATASVIPSGAAVASAKILKLKAASGVKKRTVGKKTGVKKASPAKPRKKASPKKKILKSVAAKPPKAKAAKKPKAAKKAKKPKKAAAKK